MKNLVSKVAFGVAPLLGLVLCFLPGLASAQYYIYSGNNNYYGSYIPSDYDSYGYMPESYEYSYGYDPYETSYSYSYPYEYQTQSQYQSQGYEEDYSYPSSYSYEYTPSYSDDEYDDNECNSNVGGVCGQDQYIGLGAALYQGLKY